MSINKIKISNQKLWEIAQSGEDIDEWLRNEVGIGNWTEWVGLTTLPYRSFSFDNQKHEAMFILRWC